MNSHELLRQAIDQQQDRLRAATPADGRVAILAILRSRDQRPPSAKTGSVSDLVTGIRLTDLGGNKALQLCLESADDDARATPTPSGDGLDDWAERFIEDCGNLVEAQLVLAHIATGFMRMIDDGRGTIDAWIATKRAPPSWYERADIDRWAAWLADRHESALRALQAGQPNGNVSGFRPDDWYRDVAGVRLNMMTYQLGYPSDAEIGGCSVKTYCEVLSWLIAWALRARDQGTSAQPQSEHALVTALASILAVDPDVVARAISAFTLDRDGAGYHAAVPSVAAAPIVRIAPDRLVLSTYGLTTEPLLFMSRELRRRDPSGYHNTAYLRESVFRHDLYNLFSGKRFVTSPGRIELRRAAGDVRTDVDAVVFDRKTGTLGLFELKSQDPFARTTAELARQRDNVLYANRQLSGIHDWLNRHGADELLGRVDARTAKTFRVHHVYSFVLGRYLVHFSDGPVPDRRAAWGTWPQLLRLLDGTPVSPTAANPLASLFNRLAKDVPIVRSPEAVPSREIVLGDTQVFVHPSYAAYQTRVANERVDIV